MKIRMFKQENASELEQVIAKALKISNSQDYDKRNSGLEILSDFFCNEVI